MFQRVNIVDPGVIAATTAMTVLVPQGWSTRGGVVAGSGPCSEPYGVDWSAVSADGLSSIAIFPTEVWQSSNTGRESGCRRISFSSAREYLEARVVQAFPGARVLEYRDRPDFAGSAREMVERSQRIAERTGLPILGSADGGEVTFAYRVGASEMRGVLGVSAVFYMSILQNPRGGTPLTSLSGSTVGSFAATAPEGKLNIGLIEVSRRSIVPNPQWLEKLFALPIQLGEVVVKGTRDRTVIIVAGGAAATEANIESFRSGSGANRTVVAGESKSGEARSGGTQRASMEPIPGVETFLDPVSNTPVHFDQTYGNAWRVTNQDAYILTKDPNFDPAAYGLEAVRMKVVK